MKKLSWVTVLAMICGNFSWSFEDNAGMPLPEENKKYLENQIETVKLLNGPPMRMAEEMARCAGVMEAASYLMKTLGKPNAAEEVGDTGRGYAVAAEMVVSSTKKNIDAQAWERSIAKLSETAMRASIELMKPDLNVQMAHCADVVSPIVQPLVNSVRDDQLYKKKSGAMNSTPTSK